MQEMQWAEYELIESIGNMGELNQTFYCDIRASCLELVTLHSTISLTHKADLGQETHFPIIKTDKHYKFAEIVYIKTCSLEYMGKFMRNTYVSWWLARVTFKRLKFAVYSIPAHNFLPCVNTMFGYSICLAKYLGMNTIEKNIFKDTWW